MAVFSGAPGEIRTPDRLVCRTAYDYNLLFLLIVWTASFINFAQLSATDVRNMSARI